MRARGLGLALRMFPGTTDLGPIQLESLGNFEVVPCKRAGENWPLAGHGCPAVAEWSMAGFQGFSEVRRELQRGFREGMVNLAISPEGWESLAGRDYVRGRDLSTGHRVRASLADRRGWEGRPTLGERRDHLESGGPGGVLVLTDCQRSRSGTYEAFNASPFPAGSVVLVDGAARVCAPFRRGGGSWGQSIQHVRSERSIACGSYAEVVDAILSALAEDGPGRAGAVVRGWHAATGGAMGFEVGRVFDPDARDYLQPDASFDAFLGQPDVFVAGVGTSGDGARCMDIVGRLMDENPGEIVWEVIPKRTYSLGGFVAEAAGLRTGRDLSLPFRFNKSERATGCAPTLLAFVERDGSLWPRVAVPLRGDASPVPEIRVATRHATPGPLPAPEARPSRDEPVAAPMTRRSKGMYGAIGALNLLGPARPAPAGTVDPLAVLDAPPPIPPELGLPLIAASARGGAPDLGGPEGAGPEDVVALARLECHADALRALGAA